MFKDRELGFGYEDGKLDMKTVKKVEKTTFSEIDSESGTHSKGVNDPVESSVQEEVLFQKLDKRRGW